MNKKSISLFFLLSVFYFLLSTSVAFAENATSTPPSSGWYLLQDIPCIHEGGCQLIDLLKLGRAVSNFILKYVGVIALIFFIIGGIIWITSSGNPERIKRGKHILVGSLIGILIVFFAWQIVNLVICAVSQGKIAETCTIFGNQKWNIFPQ